MKTGNICEVTQQFIIEAVRDNNIPLEFAIYEDVDCTVEINRDDEGKFTSEALKLKAGEEESKNIYLKVIWPADQNDQEYAYEIGYFTINVIITQVD